MTRRSIREYAAAVRPRYHAAQKAERGRILDEFCKTTGYHRKAAIRLFRPAPQRPAAQHPGRPPIYGADLTAVLTDLWTATDHICGKRLAPFLPELVSLLEEQDALTLTDDLRGHLLSISAATVDRLLRPFHDAGLKRPFTSTHSAALLHAQIRVRTWADWANAQIGDLQVDLVAHCGESTEGFYLNSLVGVDVVTGWTVCVPVWGKQQGRVGAALDAIRRVLPFPLRSVHSDNGGEFINQQWYDYCQRHAVSFTRGRAYRKNDQAYVEQKNWSVIRRLVGYDRYSTKLAYQQMQGLYPLINRYVNFFQPLRKVIAKERVGSKLRKRYDAARTPWQRLRDAGLLDQTQMERWTALYRQSNPHRLLSSIEAELQSLWELADTVHTTSGASESV